jgi:hypothetical protein
MVSSSVWGGSSGEGPGGGGEGLMMRVCGEKMYIYTPTPCDNAMPLTLPRTLYISSTLPSTAIAPCWPLRSRM